MPLKTLTVPDWTQADLDRVIAGGAPPLPPAGTLISGVALSSDWNQIQGEIDTAVGNCVPYTGATGPVDLGLHAISAGQLLLNDFAGTSTVGSITTDVDGSVNITHVPSGVNFVGYNGISATPYFGSDPTAVGYGVSYSSGITYFTANGGAQAQGFQMDGAGVINGDSSSYVTPFTVNDACSYDDGSTSSFTVYNTGLGREGLRVDNQGSVYMNDASTFFGYSGGGYLAGGVTWNTTGQLRVGGGNPIYAYLEAIGSSYSHLRMGQNDSIYSQIDVDGSAKMAVRPSTNHTQTFQVQNSGGTGIFNVDSTNGRVGVNITAPEYQFDARGTATSYVQARSSSANSTAGFLLRNDVRLWSIEVYGGVATDDFRIYDQTGGGARFQIAGGSGNITILTGASFGSSSSKILFNASTATNVIDWDINASSTANNTFFRFGNGTLTSASSGVSNIISSTPSINQSGTAGYTAINVNVTETATGSGAKNLLKLAVGGTEKFSVSNTGVAIFGAQARLKGYTVATLPAGTQGDTAFVTDALAPVFLTAVVGGGAVATPVFYDGAAWVAA